MTKFCFARVEDFFTIFVREYNFTIQFDFNKYLNFYSITLIPLLSTEKLFSVAIYGRYKFVICNWTTACTMSRDSFLG